LRDGAQVELIEPGARGGATGRVQRSGGPAAGGNDKKAAAAPTRAQ
jgi:hypothetical protein